MMSWPEGMLRIDGQTTQIPGGAVGRGVRLVLESGRPIAHVAKDLGISSEVLRKRVRQAEADNGTRPDLPTTAEREEIRKLRREVYELRRANEILKSASVYFAKELDADRPK
jgi:transposase